MKDESSIEFICYIATQHTQFKLTEVLSEKPMTTTEESSDANGMKLCGYCTRLIDPADNDVIQPLPNLYLHRACGNAYKKNGYSLTNLKVSHNWKQFLRFYKLYSLIILFTIYVIDLQIWIQSSENGLANGVYTAVIRTDVIGENWIELVTLLSILPGIILLFAGPFVRLVQKQRPPLRARPEAR